MRTSAAVIAQQTLTAEAATVVKHAVCDAQRRGHGQVTPLHVASSLLTSSITGHGSVLRQACLLSHRHLPHPLQCRALELCFNVALERLPTLQASVLLHAAAPAPAVASFSNALVAALKRAQAHQRRGCPEQQQVPLLAVKVEMEQLIISILDDPSVSRVMREAGFSSTHVKNSLEEAMGRSSSMNIPSPNLDLSHDLIKFSYGDQPTTGLKLLGATFGRFTKQATANSLRSTEIGGLSSTCMNPEKIYPSFLLPLLQREHHTRSSIAGNLLTKSSEIEQAAVKEVMEILVRKQRRNPLIISEQGLATNAVVKELLDNLEKNNDVDARLKGAKLVSLQLQCSGHQSKEEIELELLHLRRLLEYQHISSGVIVFLGDVQWLVDGTSTTLADHDHAKSVAAAELKRLVLLYGGSGHGRLWLIGTATNQTYWLCQAQSPSSLENEWGFQPVRSITALGSNVRSMLPRFEHPADRSTDSYEGSLGCDLFQGQKAVNLLRLLDDMTLPEELRCCPECTSNFESECNVWHEQELTSNVLQESVHSSSSLVDLFNRNGKLSTLLQPRSNFDHRKEGMAKKVQWDAESHSFAQKLRSLRQKWNHLCLTQHKEFHYTRPATPTLVHEPASSSSQNPMTNFDEKTQSESTPFASLQGLDSRGDYLKLSIAPKPSWLSLQSQPTSKFLTNSSSELDLIEQGCAGSFVASPSGVSHKEELSNSFLDQRLDQQKSELTVQTDLALGRSVEQTKLIEDCASAILFGGSSSSYKSLTARKYDIATRTAEAAVLSWQDCFTHLSDSVSADICPSESVAHKFKENSFPFRVVRQVDSDGVKGLQAKLEARIPWQKEASKEIATVVMECRSGMGKKKGMRVKSDTWLLFLGSDRVGKRKMAKALAESVFECPKDLVRISFGKEDGNSQQHNVDNMIHELNVRSTEGQLLSKVSNRGKTAIDRIAEAVRVNPFSVVLLEDIDKADSMTRNSLSRAMETGRLQESNGREISFANVIVAMTSSVGVEHLVNQHHNQIIRFYEERLIAALGCGMRVTVEKEASQGTLITSSRNISVLNYGNLDKTMIKVMGKTVPLVTSPKLKAEAIEAICNAGKKRKRENPAGPLLEFDLNLPVTDDDEELYRDEDLSPPSPILAPSGRFSDAVLHHAEHSFTKGFFNLFDSIVTFQNFNFDEIAKDVLDLLDKATSVVVASRASMEIEFTVIENLVAAVWEELSDREGLEMWAKEVLEPSMSKLFQKNKFLPGMVVKLVSHKGPLFKECLTISGLPKSISIDPD